MFSFCHLTYSTHHKFKIYFQNDCYRFLRSGAMKELVWSFFFVQFTNDRGSSIYELTKIQFLQFNSFKFFYNSTQCLNYVQ